MSEPTATGGALEGVQLDPEAPDVGGAEPTQEPGLDLPGLTPEEPSGPTPEDLQTKIENLEKEKNGLLNDLRSTRSQNRQRMEMLEDRLTQINERLTPEEPEDPEPDREENPMEWIAWDRRQQSQRLERIEDRLEGDAETKAAAGAYQQVIRAGRQAEDEHLGSVGMEREEYLTKLDMVRQSRQQYYENWGYDTNAAKAQVHQEELSWMAQRISEGENPAKMVLEAFDRMGLQMTAAETPAPGQQPAPGSKGLSAIEAAKAGKQSGGLDQAPSDQAGGVVLTLQALGEMKDDDFDKAMNYLDKHPGKWKELNMAGSVVL